MSWTRAWPLRRLILGQFLIVVAVAALVAGLLVVYWRLPMVQAQARAEHTRVAQLTLDQIQSLLSLAETTQRSLAQVLVRRGEALSPAFLQRAVEAAADTELIGSVLLLDDNARLIAVAADEPWSARAQAALGFDMGSLPSLALIEMAQQPLWSDHYRSLIQNESVVALTQRVGRHTVVLEVALQRLAQRIYRSSEIDGLLIVVADSRGEVIVSSRPGLAETRVNIRNLGVVQEAARLRPEMRGFALGDSAYVGMAARLSPLNWTVLTGYPVAVANASKRAAIGISVITLALSVLTGFVLFGGLAGRFRQEVQRSVLYAQRIAQGGYTPVAGRSHILELQNLDASLGEMAQKIQNREQQIQAIVDTTPNVAIQWFDAQGRVVRWNWASERILGWTAQEAEGKLLSDLIYTAAQQDAFLKVLHEIDRTGEPVGPYEGEVLTKTGEAATLLSTTFSIPDEVHGKLFVCMDVDITAIKRQE
ncbi:MAG: hypothetical protein Fur007_11120 [Rhodoferax sp.]